MGKTESLWIQEGYKTFAFGGPQSLKVELLARKVQKNKSGFYHYFADLELFTEKLLDHHLVQAHILAEKEAGCTSLDELIDILVLHKIDLLFNRQLRFHRQNPVFRACFEKTTAITGPVISELWAASIGLTDHSYLASLVLALGLDNFYLQITEENLNHEWLRNYFAEFQHLVQVFKNAHQQTPKRERAK